MKLEEIQPLYIDNTQYNIHDYVNYVDDVINGRIVAGEYIRLACHRMRDWFDREDIYFDIDSVDKIIKVIYKLRHSAGRFHNKNFRLLGWQQFLIANIFGWKHKDTGLRVTQKVFCMVSRKNGKTALMAAICLASLIVDRQHQSEIDFVANSAKQASIAFDMTTSFIKSIDPNQRIFKRYRSEIRIPSLESKIQVLCSDSMTLDGYNASICILDEMHAMKDFSLYNVLRSSQGAREEPLMVCITTAGFLVGDMYPCYSMWQNSIDILRGKSIDDTQFSMIFQMDDGDDWEDESVWTKFCPSLGQTVAKTYLRDEINSAKNNQSLEIGVRTKNLNQWCQSEEIWLPHTLIKQSMQSFDINDLVEMGAQQAYLGVDLAAVSDLTAISLCTEIDGKYYFKSWAFVPEDNLETGVNSHMYFDWKRKQQIEVTEGNVTDYDYIIEKVKEIDRDMMLQNIGFDSWNSTQWVIKMTEEGFKMTPFSQAIGYFSRYTKEFERQLRAGNIVIDKNQVTEFCFQNAVLKTDINANVKPTKGKSKSGKIDVVISMIQAFGTLLNENNTFELEVV